MKNSTMRSSLDAENEMKIMAKMAKHWKREAVDAQRRDMHE
jgi:hypothetical protein